MSSPRYVFLILPPVVWEVNDELLANEIKQANALAPNWGPTIFQSAHEIASNAKLREKLDEVQAQTDAEKAWWEKKRGQIKAEFMKELDGSTKSEEDEAVLVDTPSKAKGKN